MASGTSRPRGNRLNPATVRLVVAIGLEDIQAARERIGDETRNTPIKRSTTLSRMTGSDFHLKLENFQRTGSFKVRGAINGMDAICARLSIWQTPKVSALRIIA